MHMPRPITAKQILQLVEAQAYKCAISGRDLTPETASLDHITPIGRGGEHVLENLWIVDRQVNAAKGSMTNEEFFALCEQVADAQRKNRGNNVS